MWLRSVWSQWFRSVLKYGWPSTLHSHHMDTAWQREEPQNLQRGCLLHHHQQSNPATSRVRTDQCVHERLLAKAAALRQHEATADSELPHLAMFSLAKSLLNSHSSRKVFRSTPGMMYPSCESTLLCNPLLALCCRLRTELESLHMLRWAAATLQ